MSQPITRINAIGDNLCRISTAVLPDAVPGGFTFNQYLLVDDAPLLVHTGPRGLLGAVTAAVQVSEDSADSNADFRVEAAVAGMDRDRVDIELFRLPRQRD